MRFIMITSHPSEFKFKSKLNYRNFIWFGYKIKLKAGAIMIANKHHKIENKVK